MSDKSAALVISPDGRFEVILEETTDRIDILYDTVLVERATGRRLFTCQGAPRTKFATLSFDLLTAYGVRIWTQERKRARSQGGVSHSSRPG